MERSEDVFIYVPYDYTPHWKVTVDGTDVTDDLRGFKFTNTLINRSVGSFEITLDDTDGTYSDTYSGNETVIIYLDLDGSFSTSSFKGTVETLERKKTSAGFTLVLKGSHVSVDTLNVHVTESIEAKNVSTTLKDLIDDYLAGFTYNNVDTITETITTNWSNKPLRECISDICNVANADCYVDNSNDFHFFEKNSITNTDDAVTPDTCIENKGIGEDITKQKTKVVVIGSDDEGMPIIYTSGTGNKEKIIVDNNANTMDEVKARAIAELNDKIGTDIVGKAECFYMNYITPGELIWVSLPFNNIYNTYKAVKVTHDFKNMHRGYPTTEIEVSNPRKGVPEFMRDRLERELSQEAIDNPNKMDYTYNFTFDDSTNLNHSNTAIKNGELILKSGETEGTATSDAKETDDTITQMELRFAGSDLDSSKFEISSNNGLSWHTVDSGDLVDAEEGQNLKLRITLNSTTNNPTPKVESAVILYK